MGGTMAGLCGHLKLYTSTQSFLGGGQGWGWWDLARADDGALKRPRERSSDPGSTGTTAAPPSLWDKPLPLLCEGQGRKAEP